MGLLLCKTGQDRRQQCVAVFFGYAEADFTLGSRLPHRDDSLIERFNDLPRDGKQTLALAGQRDSTPMAFEQTLTDDILKFLHLKADSGLRTKQTRRAAADTAGFGDGQEAAQQIAIELGKESIFVAHS